MKKKLHFNNLSTRRKLNLCSRKIKKDFNPIVKQGTNFCLLLVFFMCIVPYNLKGQSISFNLNSISNHPLNQEYIQDSVEVNYSFYSKNKSTDFDIAYSYSISNTTELFISVGALIATNYTHNVNPLAAPFSRREATVNDKRNQITARVGFLKNVLEKDRFILRGGLSFNYANGYTDENKEVVEWYDMNGMVTNRLTTKSKKPNYTNYGLAVMLRNEYFLTKSMSIYLDIHYLSTQFTQSGRYTETWVWTDATDDAVIDEQTRTIEYTNKYFSQRPLYSIGISWNFLAKKNNPKVFSLK